MKNLCDTCMRNPALDSIGGCPYDDQYSTIKCGAYKCIAHIEDVDEDGGTYRCSFCGEKLQRYSRSCSGCGAKFFGR